METGGKKYPELYKKLFYKGESPKEEDVQKAWDAVDSSWKEIIINLQRTEDALKVEIKKDPEDSNNS